MMMAAKLAVPGLHRITVFWKKGYDVINYAHDVINKVLSQILNYMVDVVLWAKFGISVISLREVNHNFNFIRIWSEKQVFFDGWCQFKFNNLGLY